MQSSWGGGQSPKRTLNINQRYRAAALSFKPAAVAGLDGGPQHVKCENMPT